MKSTNSCEFFVIALNEEANIGDCIRSIMEQSNGRVTVLDGGSTDRTVEICHQMQCHVEVLPGSSISARRGRAVELAASDFLCFVDADQRLLSEYPIDEIVARYFLERPALAGVQLALNPINAKRSYWVDGFAERLRIITGKPGPRVVIGTPCIFRSENAKVVGYDASLTGPSDDTLFCRKLLDRGFTLEAIPERGSEKVRATFLSTVRKADWYGMGDAEYIRTLKTPKTIRNHLFHVFIRGPILYPIQILIRRPRLVPFFVLFGLARAFGLCRGLLSVNDLSSRTS